MIVQELPLHIKILIQVLNVEGIKLGNTQLILPTTKFSSISGYMGMYVHVHIDMYVLCICVLFFH